MDGILKLENGTLTLRSKSGSILSIIASTGVVDADINSAGKVLVTYGNGKVLLKTGSGGYITTINSGDAVTARWSGNEIVVRCRNGLTRIYSESGGLKSSF